LLDFGSTNSGFLNRLLKSPAGRVRAPIRAELRHSGRRLNCERRKLPNARQAVRPRLRGLSPCNSVPTQGLSARSPAAVGKVARADSSFRNPMILRRNGEFCFP
jgi:hypothetical protein